LTEFETLFSVPNNVGNYPHEDSWTLGCRSGLSREIGLELASTSALGLCVVDSGEGKVSCLLNGLG